MKTLKEVQLKAAQNFVQGTLEAKLDVVIFLYKRIEELYSNPTKYEQSRAENSVLFYLSQLELVVNGKSHPCPQGIYTYQFNPWTDLQKEMMSLDTWVRIFRGFVDQALEEICK